MKIDPPVNLDPKPGFLSYVDRLQSVLAATEWSQVEDLAQQLRSCWQDGRQVFVCGNGGSAANALHLSNDMFYGVGRGKGPGLRIHALPANVSILTSLANDESYAAIYALQLTNLAKPGDVLIVMSGSGNSPNVLEALVEAKRIGMRSYAILGYSGGKAKAMADCAIHFPIDDMQISEDLQLILAHMIMQWLCRVGRDRAGV
jgi:D-sedoheptulose 7-phosphate isomerase